MSDTKTTATNTEPTAIVPRLAIMMFLQFFVWGAWYVSMFGFLSENGMTESNNGLSFDAAAYTVAPIAAILAPLTLGLIADRLMNTERILAILFLIGACLLYTSPSPRDLSTSRMPSSA